MSTRVLSALESHGIANTARVSWNLAAPALYEEAVRRREGLIAVDGPLVCRTGHHTGRSANDKFIVRERSSQDRVWWGKVNRGIEPAKFDALHRQLLRYLEGKELFVQDLYACADPRYRYPVRVITEYAWHSLFIRNMLQPVPAHADPDGHRPALTIIDAPRFHADPERHGTNSEVFILVNLASGLVLIGGTSYAGEIKKSVFTVLNYLLPSRNVLPMHCSANIGVDDDVALFFGLSGTGKTTLSSDPQRRLIGDDEHGWSEHGVFNFEAGCYAKTIRLSPEAEPEIYSTTRRFGTVLENVEIDVATRQLDLDDDSLTENTRAAYPLSFIDNYVPSGQGGHPSNIVLLMADAFGVMPPIARLSPTAARYHFLSGYTASWPGPRRVSPSRTPRSARASARRSCRCIRRSTRRRLARRSRATRRPRGSSTRAGPAVPMASARGCASRTPARWCGQLFRARSTRCPARRIRSSMSWCRSHARTCRPSC